MQNEKKIAEPGQEENEYYNQWSPELKKAAVGIDEWNFDIFALADACDNKPIQILTPYLLSRYGIIKTFQIEPNALHAFVREIEIGYMTHRPIYHTNVHGADVMRNLHYVLYSMHLKNYVTDLEIFSGLMAALCHDFQHTGTTNSFHVATLSDLAITYNDRSVLENHHISASFSLMQQNECNILSHLTREEYHKFRDLFVEMILSTDMAYHFELLKQLQTVVFNDTEQTIEKSKTLALILHMCDICNVAKEWKLCRRWTDLLFEEFFAQGDKEKELGLTPTLHCDRDNTYIPETQIEFIDLFMGPTLKICGDILDCMLDKCAEGSAEEPSAEGDVSKRTSLKDLRPWTPYLDENRRKWQRLCKKGL